ncbi:hypothetical protein [Burkholderia vietnamiensis]|uniref:hypothetical protein n=1 Tax=Burkholderia vietnamiensis TaxID=60552 RepID=UPI001594A04E|nr:hypothetical protein [Burkholderia vietnamiensis]MDN8071622.1 hypothetical protein [Burkholderia vietnamiensis]HDR8983600.1 hypothetical protein [Burkholderia vietnamiensis]
MRAPLTDLDLRAMWRRLRMVGNFDALCPVARHAFECTANVWRDRESARELPVADGKRRAANDFD